MNFSHSDRTTPVECGFLLFPTFRRPAVQRNSTPTKCSKPRKWVKHVCISPFTGSCNDTHQGSSFCNSWKKLPSNWWQRCHRLWLFEAKSRASILPASSMICKGAVALSEAWNSNPTWSYYIWCIRSMIGMVFSFTYLLFSGTSHVGETWISTSEFFSVWGYVED